MEWTDYGHLSLYYFPVVKHYNPSEYLELVFEPKTDSPVRRVLLQDVRLPDASSIRHHHVWAVVDRVYNRAEDAHADVNEDGGQLIAEGPYTIIPEPDESYLAFEVSIHTMPEGLQKRMRLHSAGMYRMFVTHPDETRRLALEHPRYEPTLLDLFGEKRRITVLDRHLLDKIHVEFQLAAELEPVPDEVDGFLHEVEPGFRAEHEKPDHERLDVGYDESSGRRED